jgi:prepilin-type N-terminal cleavage/methylation domain-containing protein
MNEKGVTLVELMVTIAVISILVVALGFTYEGWQGRYKVESATRTLYADMMSARTLAMQMNATYLLDIAATSYRIGRDGNGNLAIDAGEFLPSFTTPKETGYSINGAPVTLAFLARGTIAKVSSGTIQSISIPETLNLVSTADPDADCVIVYATQVHMGKMKAGVCNER